MTQDWEEAISFVLKMEGGLTNDPSDPGGLTNFGISQKSFPSLDIKNLTIEAAKQIYKDNYWKPCYGDDLPRSFAIATFDCAVNQGVGKAKRILQMALDVAVDGLIGPETLGAAAKGSNGRVKKLLALRLSEYARLMAENKSLLVFSTNWSFRVLSLYELILNVGV